MEANPEDYAIDISISQDRSIYGIAIAANDDEQIVFGVPVLRGFYAIFDVESDRLGFAPSTLSSKQPLTAGEAPSNVFTVPIVWYKQV